MILSHTLVRLLKYWFHERSTNSIFWFTASVEGHQHSTSTMSSQTWTNEIPSMQRQRNVKTLIQFHGNSLISAWFALEWKAYRHKHASPAICLSSYVSFLSKTLQLLINLVGKYSMAVSVSFGSTHIAIPPFSQGNGLHLFGINYSTRITWRSHNAKTK